MAPAPASAPGTDGAARTLVVWCPDWPVAAAGVPADIPAAAFHANRVVAASPAARAEGIGLGLRRRVAQARCPDLVVLTPDPGRQARTFEPVVAALEALTPRIEVVRPGVAALATRGPSRYFGGDEALVGRAAAAARQALEGRWAVRVGIAEGLFAAGLAARAEMVVPAGTTPEFLAPLPVSALGRPDLASLLRRLGLRTLGDVAALAEGDLAGRFGPEGIEVHRLARGLDPRPLHPRDLPPDVVVAAELDPPAERVDQAAFVAKALADDLHARLAGRGLACTGVEVVAETEHGERLARRWRHDGALTPAGLVERVRWQLDGWLSGTAATRPTAGLVLLRLVPQQVVPDDGRQLGFWGSDVAAAERAARALARVQGMLGPEAVALPQRRGGRSPAEQVALVPFFPADLAAAAGVDGPGGVPGRAGSHPTAAEPWPGQLPPPSPAEVPAAPVPAEVVDATGAMVTVDGRSRISAPPARLSVDGDAWVEVVAWAGPWPVEERWWDPAAARRRARAQVLTAGGRAHAVALEGGRWWVEATYD